MAPRVQTTTCTYPYRQPLRFAGGAASPGVQAAEAYTISRPSRGAGVLGRLGQWLRGIGRWFQRFGFGAGNRLVPLFQNITEKFVYGFLALDLVALISPRVVTSLLVGRDEYHPQEHPEVRNQSFPKQIASWIHGTLRGLNWGNCDEEMRSEFVTGAGIIATPAVLYAFARRVSGRGGNDLGFKSVRDLSEGWMSRLNGSGETHDVAGYKRMLADYLESTFADSQMKTIPIDDPAIRESLVKAGISNPTYGDYLSNRLHQWVDAVFSHEDPADRRKTLEKLMEEMGDTLGAFNRKHRLTAYDFTHERLSKPIRVEDSLLRADRIWTLPGTAGEPTRQPIGGYLEKLRLWSDYAHEVWRHAAGDAAHVSTGSLRETARGLMEKIIARKGIMAVLSVVLTGLYCAGIAFWARHHDAYPATRKYQKQNLPPAASPRFASPTPPIEPSPASQSVQPSSSATRLQMQPEATAIFAPPAPSLSPSFLVNRANRMLLPGALQPAPLPWTNPPVAFSPPSAPFSPIGPLVQRPGFYSPYFSGESERRAE